MKKNDNRINIGNKNRIENSIIGNNIDSNNTQIEARGKMSWHSKIFWRIIIPVVVAVIAALIIWKLGIG